MPCGPTAREKLLWLTTNSTLLRAAHWQCWPNGWRRSRRPSPPLSPPPRGSRPALTQVEAACLAVDACAWLGARLGLQSSDALRLAAGASLVFSAGRVALLVAADAVWQQPTSDSTQALNILVREQLAGLSGTFRFPESDAQPDAAAVFAASTAAPRVFLPWIAAASDALLLAYPSGAVRWNTACPLVCCWAAPL